MSDLVRSTPGPGGVTPYSPRLRDPLPPSEEDSLDPRRLIWILFRRRWQILLVTVLVVVPAAVATFLAQPLYRSTTLIEVSPEQVQVSPYRDIVPGAGNYLEYMTTQEQVLRGAVLHGRVVKRLMAEPEGSALRDEIPRLGGVAIQQIENSQVFRITYLAPRPDIAAMVANTYAEEYIKGHFEGRQQTREKARELLRRELATLEEKVQSSEAQLVQYAQYHNMKRVDPAQGDLAQTKLSVLAGQVTGAEGEVVAARARLGTLQKASVTEFPQSLMTPVIAGRVSTLLQLEHELTALRERFGENWPAVVQKRNEISLVREQLDREKSAALGQAREQALMELRAAEAKRGMAASAMQEQDQLVNRLQTASIQYNIIRREVETNQKLYEGLLERLKQTGVTQGMEFGNIHVIEPATPSYEVASPRVKWNLFLALVLGLALGVCVAFVSDFWSNSMATVEEVEHVTVLPVLASVPLIKTERPSGIFGSSGPLRALLGRGVKTGNGSSALAGPQPAGRNGRLNLGHSSSGAEAVRTLCASILLSQSDRPPRVLAVTSAVPGEGKTTLSTELARALADSGARTLLVECDMRRPAFSSVFGVGNEGGLSLFLSGHVPRVKMYPTSSEKLYVVTSGPSAPNPVALLNSQKMSSFLADMTASFDFVVLDTPPVLPLADARVLGAKAEGVVLVVRAGYTSRHLLRRVCSVLDASGANVLGAVLNGAESEGLGSGYYHYYHQYYDA